MNAIELADELRNAIINDCLNSAEEEWYSEIEAMLRQQDKEIKLLKADVASWMDSAIGKTPDEGYWLNFAKKANEK